MLDFKNLLDKAITKRFELFKKYEAVRIFDSVEDGISELSIDLFNKILIARIHELASNNLELENLLIKEQQYLIDKLQLTTIILWVNKKDASESEARLIWGLLPEKPLITEHGIKYQIHPLDQLNVGFFIDARDLRKQIIDIARDKNVLNLFCYSGSLGLAALFGGAKNLVQVDLSKNFLNWTALNTELNKESFSGSCSLIAEDVFSYLDKQSRRVSRTPEKSFDLIICDAPAFGRSRRGSFSFDKDLEKLLESISSVASKSYSLIITSNLKKISCKTISERINKFFAAKKYRVKIISEIQAAKGDFMQNATTIKGIYAEIDKRE